VRRVNFCKIIPILSLISLCLLSVFLRCAYAKRYFELKVGKIEITGKVARTVKEHAKGLGGVKDLGKMEGMLFLFDKVERYSFWMKGMSIPIDIVWIKDDTIVGTTENVPLGGKGKLLPMYRPQKGVNKVLELNAGTCKKWGIGEGQKVEVKLLLYTMEEVRRPGGTFFIREYLNGICARVISVDRILIRTDKKEKVVRLMGVKPIPSMYNVDTENMATDFLSKFLEGGKLVAEVDLAQKDSVGRNYSFVVTAANTGAYLNFDLIRRGYASADRSVPHIYMRKYILEEEKAKKNCTGLWAYIGCDN